MPVWLKNISTDEDPTSIAYKIARRHICELSVLPVQGLKTDPLQSTHFSVEAAHFAKVHQSANTREGWALEELIGCCAKHYLDKTAKVLPRVKINVLDCDLDLVESNPLSGIETINPMRGNRVLRRYEADIVIVNQKKKSVYFLDVKRSLQRSEPDLKTLKSIEIAARRWVSEELGVKFRLNLVMLRWFFGKLTPADYIAGPDDIDRILGFPVRTHVESMIYHYREGIRDILRKLPTSESIKPVVHPLPRSEIELIMQRIARRWGNT